MKRYFLKIMISLIATLFAINVFTLVSYAMEDGGGATDEIQGIYSVDNDTQGYEIVKDEHGYKAVLKNPDQESAGLSLTDKSRAVGSSFIGRADLSNYVKLLIPETPGYIDRLTFKYKNYYSKTNYNYSSYDKCVQYQEMNDAQTVTTITVGEFDWSLADSYIVIVETLHCIYEIEITQSDLTREITLNADSTYLAPSLSVPFDLSTYDYYGLDFLLYDEQGKFITNYYVGKYEMNYGCKIPSGHYKVQAYGEGRNNSFSLLKNDYYLTPSTKTITFSGNDMAKMSLSPGEGNSTGKQVTVEDVIFMYENFNSMYSVKPSYSYNTSYIYVSKYDYESVIILTYANDTSWRYGFTENDVDASAGSLTIKYDLNLKTQFIKPTNEVYGRSLLGQFNIINNSGQTVSITGGYSDQPTQPSKVIKLTRGSESFTFNNPSSIIVLPNPSVSGTFTVDFSVSGPLAVSPTKDSIYIYRSNSLADDAVLISIVPASVNEGQSDYILIKARNTGTNVWSSAGGYKLVAAGGSDPVASTLSYPIPDGVTIKENQEYEFVIPITAPTRGIYTSDWVMAKGNTPFGNIAAPTLYVRSAKNPYIPIGIASLEPDKTSPQQVGSTIRWICNITGGNAPVYYFKIFKGSTLVKASTAYTSTNYFDWTPTEAGNDYRAMVYVKENGSASSTALTKVSGNFTVTLPIPIKITSIVPDKTSVQIGTTIRWTCNITGGINPVYYFKIFKGSTLVQSSKAYATENYFDWTPTAAGTDYRAYVYVKENGSASSTAVMKVSGYCVVTVTAPIAITSLEPSWASPREVGTGIRWTCSITGGSNPVYFFKIFNGSTLVQSSGGYTANSYIYWEPTEAGDNYRVMVYVKEKNASSTTAVTKISGYYQITPEPISIVYIQPDKLSPQAVGTTIRWTCTIRGGRSPVYYFKVFNDSRLIKSSTAYTAANYFDWTPDAAGYEYRVMVYAKEKGASNTTADTLISPFYIIKGEPIVINSLEPDKESPQAAGTTIRWTCNITGGNNPLYLFKVFKGSTIVTDSVEFDSVNFFDWTPTKEGTDYRACVYVKDNKAPTSMAVKKFSNYFTVTAPSPIKITSVEPDKESPQPVSKRIWWKCNITGGGEPMYYFEIFKGSTLVKSSTTYSYSQYFEWIPTEVGTDYRAYVYVKENGAADSTAVASFSNYFTVTELLPIAITSVVPDKKSPQPVNTRIRWNCNITGGANPAYYFKVFKGSTLIESSSMYTITDYFDWRPTQPGTDYRVYVYVKEYGAADSTAVKMLSDYYTVTAPAPAVTESSESELSGIKIIDPLINLP